MENYVAVYATGKKLVTHGTLKAMQQTLPVNFIQPHKSYLVNPTHITSVDGNTLHCGSFRVPISKYQKEEVMEKIINKQFQGK
jgi:DNA-binding LytR/AlgR family response regulator